MMVMIFVLFLLFKFHCRYSCSFFRSNLRRSSCTMPSTRHSFRQRPSAMALMTIRRSDTWPPHTPATLQMLPWRRSNVPLIYGSFISLRDPTSDGHFPLLSAQHHMPLPVSGELSDLGGRRSLWPEREIRRSRPVFQNPSDGVLTWDSDLKEGPGNSWWRRRRQRQPHRVSGSPTAASVGVQVSLGCDSGSLAASFCWCYGLPATNAFQ